MSAQYLIRPIFLLLLVSGCQSFRLGDSLTSGGREKPKTGDPWVEDAGEIARGEYPREKVNDPLGLRNYFVSEKAREIEHNVGVGD